MAFELPFYSAYRQRQQDIAVGQQPDYVRQGAAAYPRPPPPAIPPAVASYEQRRIEPPLKSRQVGLPGSTVNQEGLTPAQRIPTPVDQSKEYFASVSDRITARTRTLVGRGSYQENLERVREERLAREGERQRSYQVQTGSAPEMDRPRDSTLITTTAQEYRPAPVDPAYERRVREQADAALARGDISLREHQELIEIAKRGGVRVERTGAVGGGQTKVIGGQVYEVTPGVTFTTTRAEPVPSQQFPPAEVSETTTPGSYLISIRPPDVIASIQKGTEVKFAPILSLVPSSTAVVPEAITAREESITARSPTAEKILSTIPLPQTKVAAGIIGIGTAAEKAKTQEPAYQEIGVITPVARGVATAGLGVATTPYEISKIGVLGVAIGQALGAGELEAAARGTIASIVGIPGKTSIGLAPLEPQLDTQLPERYTQEQRIESLTTVGTTALIYGATGSALAGKQAAQTIASGQAPYQIRGSIFVRPTSDVIKTPQAKLLRLGVRGLAEIRTPPASGFGAYNVRLAQVTGRGLTVQYPKELRFLGQPPTRYGFQFTGAQTVYDFGKKVSITTRVEGAGVRGSIYTTKTPAAQLGLGRIQAQSVVEVVRGTEAAKLQAKGIITKFPKQPEFIAVQIAEPIASKLYGLKAKQLGDLLKAPTAKPFKTPGIKGTIERVRKGATAPPSTIGVYRIRGVGATPQQQIAVRLIAFGKTTKGKVTPTTPSPLKVATGGRTIGGTGGAQIQTTTLDQLTRAGGKRAGAAVTETLSKIAQESYVSEVKSAGAGYGATLSLLRGVTLVKSKEPQAKQATAFRTVTQTKILEGTRVLTPLQTRVIEGTRVIPPTITRIVETERILPPDEKIIIPPRIPPVIVPPRVPFTPGVPFIAPPGGQPPGGTGAGGGVVGGETKKKRKGKLIFSIAPIYQDILALGGRGFGTPLPQKTQEKFFRAMPFPELIPPKEFGIKAPTATRGNIMRYRKTSIEKGEIGTLLFGRKTKRAKR